MYDILKQFILANPQNWAKTVGNANNKKHNDKRNWLIAQTTYLPENSPMSRRWWHIEHGPDIPSCKECGNAVSWNPSTVSYLTYCSTKCSTNSSEVRLAAETTFMKNYGVSNPFASESIKKRIKKTNKARYGVEVASKSNVIQKKIVDTMIERYGVDNPAHSHEIINKTRHTVMNRYGVDNVMKVDAIKEKAKTTTIERYGVDNVMKLDSIKEDIKSTNLNRYGVHFSTQKHISTDSLIKLNDPIWLTNEHHNKKVTLSDIADTLGVRDCTVGEYFKLHDIQVKRHFQSSAERELTDFLTNLNISFETRNRSIIGRELDIVIEGRLAIEYNGLYWHSELSKKDAKTTHQVKYLLCKANNIRLLNIFENEWVNNKELIKKKILNILGYGNQHTVYARKTSIIEVSTKDKSAFFEANHIQGDGPSSINYGLVYDGELLACIGFIKQKNQFILNRYATKCNIPGGFTKLLTHFENEYNTPHIVTFADLRWSNGDLYTKTNFTLDAELPPDYYWCKGIRLWHKFNWRHTSGLKMLPDYDSNKTEVENMHQHGFYRIWDCGKLRFTKN